MIRVLLTSFEPFGGHKVNSSHEAARAATHEPLPGVELDWLVLPVIAGACVKAAWERVLQTRPALVLATGQSSSASVLKVEEQAVNLDDFPMPDNSGVTRTKQPIVPSGPTVYRATLPAARLVRHLRGLDLPAEVSGSAGSYVCNHLFYGLLHHAAVAGLAQQTGFVHLPLLPEQVDPKRPQPSWPLDRVAAGVRTTITACLGGPCRSPLSPFAG